MTSDSNTRTERSTHKLAHGLSWHELYFPVELSLAEVTRVLQPLAQRPKLGWRQQTPIVVFELRIEAGAVRWLLGFDQRLGDTFPGQLRAQLPGLVIVRRSRAGRTRPLLVSNVRPIGLAQPLRVEMAAGVTAGLLEVMNALDKDESAVVQWVIGPGQQRHSQPTEFNLARSLGLVALRHASSDQQRGWQRRSSEPLFAVRARIGARAALPEVASAVVRMLGSALQLANASHTGLKVSKPTMRGARRINDVFSIGMRWAGILNAAELAALLGWPVDGATSLRHVYGRQHPAPSRLVLPPKSVDLLSSQRILGASVHPADGGRLVAMPTQTALHHLHVVGPTGSGKSTLLAQLVHADMAAGHSVLVIEPRGDLVADVLTGVPEDRRDDVVLIEPGATNQVVGINPLAGSPEDAERRADQLLHLLHELYGSSLGPRSSDVLLHALIALARSPDGTFADLPVLLTNSTFRRRLLAKVGDPLVLAPFFAWYDGLSDAERHQVIAPVLNKTRAFLSRTAIRRLLGQASPRFQLDDLFTERRIVLVNLNTGVVGSETARFIGALLVTQLWQAMQRRAEVPAPQRHPVMAVIDEVQNYLKLPVDLGDLFAQARGLHVGLTVAHQHLHQLPPKLRAALLANARSRVVFHPSAEDCAHLAAVLGGGLIAQDLERLGAFEAYARLLVERQLSEPFIVRTQRLPEPLSDPAELRRTSQQRYGVDGAALDDLLKQRWHGGDSPNGPIGQVPRRAA
ncbi:type IV secretory system conjugative DNA transfer family protein [Allokutzneria sp. A3M-2-11 16]|uniref:type IV secretory system conjugative DNA transfer family protein n=1 Tax=Allokutzneria sp. A3M-2-11 16 TaxID=2962043 RepID=UPI0020B7C10E|nr:type IV secretion system DNA-binding domain-containing protein [Allokutzneria sp. A3M-2-11 16]MCP3797955.1 type IV secretory system conjugative DNA transfer family protein [Allokutzneria sp. A3M-2-11 16]